jgi:transposase
LLFVGFDRADDRHQVCLLDGEGVAIDLAVSNTPEDLARLLTAIREQEPDPAQVLVALEDPKGPFFEAFLDAGYMVYPINPKALERFRERYHLSGTKTDVIDARALADLLRKDRDAFQPLQSDSELTRELRVLTRDAADLEKTQTMLVNQLLDALKLVFPGVLAFFSDFTAPVALAFLAAFPNLDLARQASLRQIREVLRKAGQPLAAEKAKHIYEGLHGEQFTVDPVTVRGKTEQIRTLVALLRPLHQRALAYQRRIRELLKDHPDRAIFLSLPGAGTLLAARMASEFGDRRERFPSYRGAAAFAGTAPVTRRSGKSRVVVFRRGCCKPFRETMYQFAFCSLTKCDWAHSYYRIKRAQGLKHAEALRCLGNVWMRIIVAMWRNRTTYDEHMYLVAKGAVSA